MAYGKVRVDQIQSSTRTVDVDDLALDSALGTAAALDAGTGAGNVPVLDGAGKIVSAVLPSYVDDVVEYANLAAFPVTGETGKIYVAIDTNKTYRWSGSAYIEISSSPVTSVAGRTGVVTLSNTDISGLGTAATKNTGTASGNVVELDGSARLPAVDGSQLTGINTAGTDLTYTAATRLLASSTGTDATLPLFSSADAGLAPASGGGTTNFLRADGTFAAPPGGSPGGSTTQVQFNNAGAFGGDADLTWNSTTNVLGVTGDVNLSDGGTFTTTLQCITPTAARTISFPDATGTVALVGGSSGQLLYNNAGANAGLSTVTTDGTNVTLTGRFISSLNGAASAPPGTFTGTWFTGGTSTTTKPQVLIEPTGATSTAWSTSGTGLGVNAASGFAGRLLDLQLNGTSNFSVSSAGAIVAASLTQTGEPISTSGATLRLVTATSTTRVTINNTGLGIGTTPSYAFHVNAGPSSSWGVTNGSTINLINFSDTNGINLAPGSSTPLIFTTGGAERGRFNGAGGLTLADANNIAVGTTTGTKIGTATTQKLGFYNATPVVQPVAVANAVDTTDIVAQFNALLARMRDLGLIAT